MLLLNLTTFAIGFIYIILNILQSAFLVAGKRNLMSLCHFIVALMWVAIIVLIVKNPIENGIAYAIGSSLGMLFSGYFNNTIIVSKK